MPGIYDDPRLRPDNEDERIKFDQRGDRVRGQIIKTEPLDTINGWVAKYWIWDIDRNVERTLLAGATSLWGQLLTLKPEPLDVIDITLIDFQTNQRGTAKIFDVQILERQARPLGPMASRPAPQSVYATYQPSNGPQAPAPAPQTAPQAAYPPAQAPQPEAPAYPAYQPTGAAPAQAPAPYVPTGPAPSPQPVAASSETHPRLAPAYADEDEDLFER